MDDTYYSPINLALEECDILIEIGTQYLKASKVVSMLMVAVESHAEVDATTHSIVSHTEDNLIDQVTSTLPVEGDTPSAVMDAASVPMDTKIREVEEDAIPVIQAETNNTIDIIGRELNERPDDELITIPVLDTSNEITVSVGALKEEIETMRDVSEPTVNTVSLETRLTNVQNKVANLRKVQSIKDALLNQKD